MGWRPEAGAQARHLCRRLRNATRPSACLSLPQPARIRVLTGVSTRHLSGDSLRASSLSLIVSRVWLVKLKAAVP